MFNFSEYEDKKAVMHCKTEEEAKLFCKEMHDAGLKWRNNSEYISDNYWYIHEEEMCYEFNTGEYSNIDFYKEEGYEILEFSDVYNKLNERQKFFLKMIGRGYLARNKDDNRLIWFENKPINCYNREWLTSTGEYFFILEKGAIFPDLSFIKQVSEKNDKPYNVEELLKRNGEL